MTGSGRRHVPWKQISVGLAALGLAALFFSWRWQDERTWLSGQLSSVGITFFLFLPLFFIQRRIEVGLDKIETATEEGLGRVDQAVSKLAQIDEQVQARLQDARAPVLAGIGSVAENPTLEAVSNAVELAQTRGLVSQDGPRVALPGTSYTVRFVVHPDEWELGRLWLQVEEPSGRFVSDAPWRREQSVGDVSYALVTALSAADSGLTPEHVEVAAAFSELARLLSLVDARATGPGRVRKAVQLFDDQWLLTEHGLQSMDPAYPAMLAPDQINDPARTASAWTGSAEALERALATARLMPTPLGRPTFP